MISVKPPLSNRIFFGIAGIAFFITACAGLVLFPLGLLMTCLGIPLGVLASLYALGVPETQFGATGISRRNLFFMTQRLSWETVDGAEFFSYTHRSADQRGWERTRSYLGVEIVGRERKFRVHTYVSNPEAWWPQVEALVRERVPAERIHQR